MLERSEKNHKNTNELVRTFEAKDKNQLKDTISILQKNSLEFVIDKKLIPDIPRRDILIWNFSPLEYVNLNKIWVSKWIGINIAGSVFKGIEEEFVKACSFYIKNSGFLIVNKFLQGINLRAVSLMYANLTNVILSYTDLSYTDLYRADLSNGNLDSAILSESNLNEANLTRANLHMANLTNADLTQAILFEANLYGADLQGANLYGADLRGANLEKADLRNSEFIIENTLKGNLNLPNVGESTNFNNAITNDKLLVSYLKQSGIDTKKLPRLVTNKNQTKSKSPK